jgi:gliding motility-associated protein GldM
MPLMTKLILDVQNTEADIISWLAGDVDSKSFKFTSLVPLVVPQSSYLLRGDSFRAEVLLAAFDNTNRPSIYVDNNRWNGRDSSTIDASGLSPLKLSSSGFGALRIATNNLPLGEAAYKGVIKMTGPDGSVEEYPFITPTFQVAEPALVVSPTQMNVFYRGVPNPVEVSVPGVASDKITVTINNGHKITKQPDGSYIVEPGANADADISVTAELPDGSKKSMPAKKFRVKRIPDPVPTFGGKSPSDRSIDRTTLRGVPGVSARMENFDFNVQVVVKSFQLVVSKDGTLIRKASNSNRLSDDMKALLESCARGTVIYLEDIVVQMPDNTEQQLAPLKLTVN